MYPGVAGKLRYVGWEGADAIASDYMKEFRTKNNIDYTYTYVGSPDETIAKVSTDPGTVDLADAHVEMFQVAYEAGLLDPIDLTRLSNYETVYPGFKTDRWVFPDGKHYCVPTMWGDSPVVYDPAKWPDGPPPKIYPDLADPKYRGALVTSDDPYMNLFNVSQSLGNPDPIYITQAQLDECVKAFKEIKKNIVAITPGALSDIVDLLVRGDATMCVFSGWEAMVPAAAEKGKELKFATPAVDKGYWWIDNFAIPKAAVNKDAAYAFINELISARGNAALADGSASGGTQSKSWDYFDPKIRGWYPYDQVKVANPPKDHPINLSMDPPPKTTDKGIVGIAEWKRAWQECKMA